MTELLWFLAGVLFTGMVVVVFVDGGRIWKWIKFSVWFDFRYAEGYRKGRADGIRSERGWRDYS